LSWHGKKDNIFEADWQTKLKAGARGSCSVFCILPCGFIILPCVKSFFARDCF